MKRAIVLAVLLLSATACGDDDEENTPDPVLSSPKQGDVDLEFHEITHPDGTIYRCLYTYQDGGDEGGPALWCERLLRSSADG